MALLVDPNQLQSYVFKRPPEDVSDEEKALLAALAEAVSGWIERRCGPVLQVTVTERHDGGTSRLFLRRRPVVEVKSVKEAGVDLTPADFVLYGPEGVLVRVAGGYEIQWAAGLQSVEVTYTAGRAATVADVPPEIRGAVLRWTYELYHSQPDNITGQVTESAIQRSGTPPEEVMELLRPYLQVHVA
ncbi:MAG TPA: hypothetical protein VIK73_08305 [Limnochordales bacterium]